jgi:MoCo/4Fe-4S cofactor protein with predicted Tat translocation signal
MNARFDLDVVRRRIAQRGARRFWASIDELLDEARFRTLLTAEFPSAADVISDPQRRHMLKLMGASLLLAGLGGCSDNRSEQALPYVNQPENVVPGIPRYYATAVLFEGYAQPVIATTFDGRPTKLDGNPDHPATRGKSDIFMQSAVLGLYDPERAKLPSRRGIPSTWAVFERELADLRQQWSTERGRGVRLVMGRTTSPTLDRQVRALLASLPEARLHLFDPIGAMRRDEAMAAIFGRIVEPHLALDACETMVSLDDDFLGPGPQQVRYAIAWATSRGEHAPGAGRSRLYVAEGTPSATGTVASTRIACETSRMHLLAQAITSGDDAGLTERERAFVQRSTRDLSTDKGGGLVLAGAHLDPEVQALVARANATLGHHGRTINYSEPIHACFEDASSIAALSDDIAAGQVETLIMLDCNPAYAAPGTLNFAQLLPRVRNRIHVGLHDDETAALCDWQLPLSHALESWSDARAVDGTATILQPVVRPLYSTRSIHQIVDMLTGAIDPAPDAAVRATWKSKFGNDGPTWKQALHAGFISGTAASFVSVAPIAAPSQNKPSAPALSEDRVEIIFRPDPTVWDGRLSNIATLQELPKPITKITWDNIIGISPVFAGKNQIASGDHVEVSAGQRSIKGAAWIVPGQAAGTVALYFGYGRRRGGDVGNGVGYDAYALRDASSPHFLIGSIRRLGESLQVATTQGHHRIDGFDFVREVTAESPRLAPPKDQPTLYPPAPETDIAWGMVIDLDLCIGCNACVTACNVENNVPVVGKDQVARGRVMHWLRIDQYYTGDIADPRTYFQPVPCMHCEKAPCEMGCPVHATVHSPEGVNQMVYNRCIGTRTCSSYCPYKVRRFNWYDYRQFGEADRAAKNPDVTVRSRGVMEKCTYCTHRIEAAHVAADKDNRPLREIEVVTACQQACPTQAISFGNIRTETSEVARRRNSGRHYVLLEEVGTRPRTTYLARWNDDPEREGSA